MKNEGRSSTRKVAFSRTSPILRLEDLDERKAALNAFNRRFKPEAADIPLERVVNCCVVEVRIAEMTGRQERERKRTCWRYTF